MTDRLSGRILVLALLSFALLISTDPIHAQTPTPPSRDAVIAEIKVYAERHVANDGPMQTQLLVDLFWDNTVGLTPQEIARIYEEEYARLNEESTHGSWELLLPKAGWVAFGVLSLWVVFRDVVRKWIASFIEWIGSRVYDRLAGSRFFHGMALRRYRQALIDRYRKLRVPFRPDRPLDMSEVYVPLKVAGATSDDQIDAYGAIAGHRRLMVVGSPGSGKSTLLKHIALTLAEDPPAHLPDQPVPVLLELHRLNDPKLSLEQHIVAELARNEFPHAERFVSYSLKQSKLMLLLDGLDEVNSSQRRRVVQQVSDLLDEHKRCRVVITCRSAVYKREFDATVDQTLEIAEFSDQQIHRFLRSWEPDMPADKSIEQLMQTLHDTPRIKTLASFCWESPTGT